MGQVTFLKLSLNIKNVDIMDLLVLEFMFCKPAVTTILNFNALFEFTSEQPWNP